MGTVSTRVFLSGEGIVLNEPSVVAVDCNSGQVLASGSEAALMHGKIPKDIKLIRPFSSGVIADFESARLMLKHLIKKVKAKSWLGVPQVVVAVPQAITKVECRAVIDVIKETFLCESIHLVEESVAAAFGANLPITEPVGSCLINIGGGHTAACSLSMQNIVVGNSIGIGGVYLSDCIIRHMRKKHNMKIGKHTAHSILSTIGQAKFHPNQEDLQMKAKGIHVNSGLPRTLEISSSDVNECIISFLNKIVNLIKLTLETTPPELAADIYDRGITLTGGVALLKGLDQFISNELKILVNISENPQYSVSLGTGLILEKHMRHHKLSPKSTRNYSS